MQVGPEEKRANLIHAKGELKVGRRPAPEPEDPRIKRRYYGWRIALGAVVVVAVVVLIMVLGANTSI